MTGKRLSLLVLLFLLVTLAVLNSLAGAMEWCECESELEDYCVPDCGCWLNPFEQNNQIWTAAHICETCWELDEKGNKGEAINDSCWDEWV